MKQALAAAQFETDFVRPRDGRTLIVGSHVYEGRVDRRLLYRDVLGVDMVAGAGVDRVLDLEELLPADLGQFDHVECMSVLEHSKRPWLLAENIERLMRPGATLHLAVPFVWRIHGYPSDYFRFTPDGVRVLFPNIEWRALKLACDKLRDGPIVPATHVNGHAYLGRTEVVGFGVR